MRHLLCLIFVVGLIVIAPEPVYAQQGKSISYGTIRCDSWDRDSWCPIDTGPGVRLVREFSNRRCYEANTWGVTPHGIWVSGGCQAEFQIGNPGGGWNPGGGGGSAGDVICESQGRGQQYCSADTRYGVDLVEQLSRADCIRNRSWGYDRRGIWVSDGCRARFRVLTGGGGWPGGGGQTGGGDQYTTRCESNDGRRNYCPTDLAQHQVRLNRTLSRAQCVEGRSWGWDRSGIWVSDGCRGEFLIERRRGGGGGIWGGGNAGATRTFVCESRNNRQVVCNVDTSRGVRLVRQLSNAACVERQTWGVDRTGVWVSNGCRAEFEISGSGY